MARTTVVTLDGTSDADLTQVYAVTSGSVTVNAGTFYGQNTRTYDQTAAGVYSGASAGSFTNDQSASIVVGGLSALAVNFGIGVICRASTDTEANRDFYGVFIGVDGGNGASNTTYLFKIVNGTATLLHSAGVVWTNGDRVELEVEGTTLRACKNGTALGGSFTQTDSSLATGKPGIIGSGGSGLITGDDWIGSNITGGVVVPVFMNHLRTQGIA